MGLLDGIFDQLFTGGRTDRGLRRLAEQGELVPPRGRRSLIPAAGCRP
jgi:hypothetical protein